MRMQPQRYDDEQPLAPVIPLFRHVVDLDDDDLLADDDGLILRFADDYSGGPNVS
jgi:hypothetical protein